VCFLEIMIHFFFFLLCFFLCVPFWPCSTLHFSYDDAPHAHVSSSFLDSYAIRCLTFVSVCGAHTPSLKQMRILFCSVIFIVVFFRFHQFSTVFLLISSDLKMDSPLSSHCKQNVNYSDASSLPLE
jgi:hypothetical protein